MGGGSVPEGEGSSLLNGEGCLVLLFFFFGVHFSPFLFNLSASIFILITSHPFIFSALPVFPIPSAFKAAEGMQLLFLMVDEMMTVSWKTFSKDVWVCVRV